VAQFGADGCFLIERDGEETVATGPDGEIARDTNPKVPLEACDEDGNSIWVTPGTYEYTDPPLEFEAEGVSLAGPWSAEITLADGQISEDDPSRCMEVFGDRFTLRGLTLDWNVQNQGHDDTYGLLFSLEERPEDCLVAWNRNFNAVGDAYGNPGPGTKLVGCYAAGFSEDGVHFKGEADEKPVLVSDSHFVGAHPFKIHHGSYDGYIGGFKASNCVFRGIDTPGVHMIGPKEMDYRNVSFHDCRIESVDTEGGLAKPAVRIATGGTIRNLTFDGCTIRGAQSMLCHDPHGTMTVENCSIRGGRLGAGSEYFLLRGETSLTATDWQARDVPDEETLVNVDADSVSDVSIRSEALSWPAVRDTGTRTTINGIGRNGSMDPRTGGDWNGHGYDGLVVTWDDEGTNAVEQYVDGAWVTIATS
jgi:hypothetical protein